MNKLIEFKGLFSNNNNNNNNNPLSPSPPPILKKNPLNDYLNFSASLTTSL